MSEVRLVRYDTDYPAQSAGTVIPYGEIPWANLSRISDEEMKALMIEVTNKVFTFLTRGDDLMTLGPAARWNKPELDQGLLAKADRRAAQRECR